MTLGPKLQETNINFTYSLKLQRQNFPGYPMIIKQRFYQFTKNVDPLLKKRKKKSL